MSKEYSQSPFKPIASKKLPLVCPHCNNPLAINLQFDIKTQMAIQKVSDQQFKNLGGQYR